MGEHGKKCEAPGKHRVHMCKLKKDGRMEEFERHGRNPIVYCNKCKVQADDPLVVCNPRALKQGKR